MSVLVTGASGGLGREAAAAMRAAGRDVVAPGRDQLDLASLASVRDFAREQADSGGSRRSARSSATPASRSSPGRTLFTPDGIETTFQVNHLAHFWTRLRSYSTASGRTRAGSSSSAPARTTGSSSPARPNGGLPPPRLRCPPSHRRRGRRRRGSPPLHDGQALQRPLRLRAGTTGGDRGHRQRLRSRPDARHRPRPATTTRSSASSGTGSCPCSPRWCPS